MSFLSGRNGCLELMLSTVKALNDYCPPVQVDNEEWYLWWEDLPVHSIFLPVSCYWVQYSRSILLWQLEMSATQTEMRERFLPCSPLSWLIFLLPRYLLSQFPVYGVAVLWFGSEIASCYQDFAAYSPCKKKKAEEHNRNKNKIKHQQLLVSWYSKELFKNLGKMAVLILELWILWRSESFDTALLTPLPFSPSPPPPPQKKREGARQGNCLLPSSKVQ